MFSTLRYTKDSSKATVCIEQANDPPGQGHGQRHSACNHCRSKKLKCLGDDKTSERKEGSSCNRCRTNGIKCVFPQPSTNKGSKRRRSTQAASRALKTNTSPTSSPATTAPMASSSLPSTGVTHKIARADFAHSTRQDTKPLSNTTIEQPTNLRSSEHAKQLNFAGTESIGGHDMHSDLMDTGNDPTHQFDFNLSMLYTADDSHGFGFLSGNSNEWSALPYGVHDSNVYRDYNTEDFQMDGSSTAHSGDYSNSTSSGTWDTVLQPNDGAFQWSRKRENTWQS